MELVGTCGVLVREKLSINGDRRDPIRPLSFLAVEYRSIDPPHAIFSMLTLIEDRLQFVSEFFRQSVLKSLLVIQARLRFFPRRRTSGLVT